MGNCGSDRPEYYSSFMSTAPKDIDNGMNKIFGFNWNKNKTSFLTVEETIMLQLTNDIGEFINPHVAHIAFSEFKKFMVLNKIFFENEKPNFSGNEKNNFVGLAAPPMIDAVWVILISINTKDVLGLGDAEQIYVKFGNEVFGVYIRRPNINSSNRKYNDTFTMLKNNSKDLKPFWNLWPDYSEEEYKLDLSASIWVTKDMLNEIVTEYIDKTLNQENSDFDKHFVKKLTTEIISSRKTDKHCTQTEVEQFQSERSKPLFNKRKSILTKKILDKVDEKFEAFKEDLADRLQQKYMLDEDTANAWIFELKKFLVIKISETDPDSTSNSLASTNVIASYQTFLEEGKKYIDISEFFFTDMMVPEAHIIHYDKISTYKNRYNETIKSYEYLFGSKPPESIWEESPDQRFEDLSQNPEDGDTENKDALFLDSSAKICVNLNRLIITKWLLKNPSNTFHKDKISIRNANDSDVTNTQELQEQGEKSKSNKEAYKWRQVFPHGNNIYYKHIQDPEGHIYIPNTYEKMVGISNIFKPGGILILRNPYATSLLSTQNAPDMLAKGFYSHVKLEDMREITLDHLADGAINNQKSFYGTLLGGKSLKDQT